MVNIHAIEQTQLRMGAQNLISTQAAALDAGGDPAETATVLRPTAPRVRRRARGDGAAGGGPHAGALPRGRVGRRPLEAEALRRESLTGGAAVLDASHEEYVRREELVAAAREVGWEPFSCEEIRAVTLG